jgi:hypothetical protein
MAMITITATANALTIRAIQRHKVAGRLIVFINACLGVTVKGLSQASDPVLG